MANNLCEINVRKINFIKVLFSYGQNIQVGTNIVRIVNSIDPFR